MADINLTAGDDAYTQAESGRNDWNNFYGRDGDDTIRIYQGTAIGGRGNDRLERIALANEPWHSVQVAYWDSPAGIRVDLLAGWADDGFGTRDTLVGIDMVSGNGHDDWIRGNDNDNYFWGNGGTDTLIGGAGIDGVGLPWFQPAPDEPWRQARIDDLVVSVSADGNTARLRPASGSGFDFMLTGIEYFDTESNGNWRRKYLADYITQAVMAEQVIAAGETFRWNAGQPLGSATSLTFSFIETAPASGVGAAGFRAFSSAERQAARNILASTAAMCGLSFTEVAETGGDSGQLRFGVSQQSATKGLSWMPGSTGAGDLAGDVWMDVETMALLAPGEEGFAALLHEIGHALGLRHPRNVDPNESWPAQLRPQDDTTALTVMSQTTPPDGMHRADWGPLDVLALRYLYGSRSLNAGDSVYRLGSREAAARTTVIDDGGIDTLDASAYTTGVRLDLTPGGLSSVGFDDQGRVGIDNLALPTTSLIENAIGSRDDDVLIGNDRDNRLTGNAGNDWIEGGAGVDTAVYLGPRADYRIISNYGKVFVEARDGISGFDTLVGIEQLAFSDQTIPTDRVTIEGTVAQGQTLNAVAVLADLASLGPISYRWTENGNLIAGNTGPTLPLTQAQVGQMIAVSVMYSDAGGEEESVSAQAGTPVANVNDPPTGSLTISGILRQGQTLTVVDTLADADGRYPDADGIPQAQIQWQANGVDIAGAHSPTFTLTESQVDKSITVKVGYRDQLGYWEEVTSAPSASVENVNDAPTGGIRISGTANLGLTLTATSTLADADGLGAFAYQWRADGVDIAAAVSNTLLLTEAQVGKIITVGVHYRDGHGTLEGADSPPTTPVTSNNAAPTGRVLISGSPVQGQTLTASHQLADADGLGPITYQWRADDIDIPGAIGARFTPGEPQVGKRLSATANYIDGHGAIEAVTSAPTRAIVNVNDPPLGTLTVAGRVVQGQSLSAVTDLSDPDGIGTLTYRWRADGIDISGATGTSLLLTEAQVGKTITVTASWIDARGSAEFVSSAPTVSVANVNDPPVGSVTIGGSASPTQGQNLYAGYTLTDLDGMGDVDYQWFADATPIAGATAQILPLTESEVDRSITVRVRYTDGHGTLESVTSQASAAVINTNDPVLGLVMLTGEATLGHILTASNTLTDRDGLGPLTYQWRIDGWELATGPTPDTLLLTENMIGRRVTVTARYTDAHGTDEFVTSTATRPVARFNAAPSGTVGIEGLPRQGLALLAWNTLGDADGLGTITYQWQAAGADIAGAVGASFTPSQAQVGQVIGVIARYTDGHGVEEAVRSPSTGLVENVNDAPAGSILITGTALQGQTLNALSNLTDADGLGSISYQWHADGVAIAGAVGSLLRLTEAQVGRSITAVARYTDGFGTIESVVSLPTAVVVNVNDAPSGTLTITGEAAVGQTLTVSNSLNDPDGLGAFNYQWRSGGVDITGANGSSFVAGMAEIGKTLTVRVSYTDGHGSFESVTSPASASVAMAIMGTTGADTLIGSNLPELIRGFAGADLLMGDTGADSLEGGIGNDTLAGGAGSDWLAGGDGDDRASFGAMDASPFGSPMELHLDWANWGDPIVVVTDEFGQQDRLESIEGVMVGGSAMNDRLWLSPGNDIAWGNGGSDNFMGFAGADSLVGGSGVDWLRGGPGNDTIVGGDGPDSDSVDYYEGEPGQFQGVTVDLAAGTAIDNWGDIDTIRGIEAVGGSQGDDLLKGDLGYNNFSGYEGDDTLIGVGAVGDHLEGGGGNDSLVGGAGGSWFRGGSGDDTVIGGTGPSSDHLDYNEWGQDPLGPALRGVHVDLSAGIAIDNWGGRDTLYDIDNVGGSNLDDYLAGDDRYNALVGQAGNDSLMGGGAVGDHLEGGAGNDLLLGGAGDDWMHGGSGDDTIDGGTGSQQDHIEYTDWGQDAAGAPQRGVWVDLAAGRAIDNWGGTDTLVSIESARGSALADHLAGSEISNSLAGNEGNDTLEGRGGDDNLHGESGHDSVAGGTGNDNMDGGDGDDSLLGEAGNDGLWGRDGNDFLQAGDDQDYASGDAGDDTLDGGAGNDTLDGGHGNDLIIGGAGVDVAQFGGARGAYRLTRAGELVTVTTLSGSLSSENPGDLDRLYGIEYIRFSEGQFAIVDLVDSVGPVVSSYLPADESVDVPVGQDITLTFNEPLQRGSGSIILKTGAGAAVAVYDAATSAQLSLSGTTLTLNPSTDLAYSTAYRLEFSPGSLLDLSGNPFAGTTSYNFTTQANPANRVVTGSAANDSLVGGPGDDLINGLGGNDTLMGLIGNDSLNGGSGIDTASYAGALANYSLMRSGNSVTVSGGSANEGTDALNGVERVRFSDMTVNLQVQSQVAAAPASDVQRIMELYVAFFNRVPDADGLSYWLSERSAGQTVNQIAENFYGNGMMYSALTGFRAGMSNDDFLNVVYRNVLGRPEGPDAGGREYWNGEFARGMARGQLVDTIVIAAHTYKGDPAFGWVADLLDNKLVVARTFAVDWGLNYNTSEDSISHGMALAAGITADTGSAGTSTALALIGISPGQIDLG